MNHPPPDKFHQQGPTSTFTHTRWSCCNPIPDLLLCDLRATPVQGIVKEQVKVKFTLEQAMKAHRRSTGIALLFL
jgi:hypothetical protein